MTVTREELDAVLASLRELKDAVTQNSVDLKIQFERISQMQAEVDSLRIAFEKRSSRKKSMPNQLPRATAAHRPDERRSRPR
jgi:hypothetical protein